MTKIVDDRSPTAKAMSKVSEIIATCLLMIVPALIGYWLDQKLATRFLFTLFGLLFGMSGAFIQLKRLVSTTNKNSGSPELGNQTKSEKADGQ